MIFFDYDLPPKLIAQHPAARRDDARLLVVRRESGVLEHRTIRDLPELLAPGDLLVRNDTKVLPARLVGTRVKTGGKWEGLFLKEPSPGVWEMIAKTRGSATTGETFLTATGLTLELIGRCDERHWLMKPLEDGDSASLLARFGAIPLPPYIRDGTATAEDRERYQTVYAKVEGSVAAPTAGLHFTRELLERLAMRGVDSANVTLHVGLGTFAPIKEANPLTHAIHEEWCEVSEPAVTAIQKAKGRTIAVGTTSARTLESAARSGRLAPFRGATSLAIYPPFEFNVVDGLLTNFHLPKTTLLLLVQSLCGSELLKRAYEEAIREEYRFYSYGDAMLVL